MAKVPHVVTASGAEVRGNPALSMQFASFYSSPVAQSANALMSMKHEKEPLEMGALTAELSSLIAEVKRNDLSRAEAILVCQAQTLDRMFTKLLMGGFASESLNQFNVKLNTALKAQRQCQATLETLALLKNPQPYVRQQNVALNQQVNNNLETNVSGRKPADNPAPENFKSTNRLLTDGDHIDEKMDARRTATASSIDQELEALAAIDRPINRSR